MILLPLHYYYYLNSSLHIDNETTIIIITTYFKSVQLMRAFLFLFSFVFFVRVCILDRVECDRWGRAGWVR